MTISELTAQAESILDEVERAVVGKREALELVLLGILADGHVLLEDIPGLAKTLIARSFAQVIGLRFARVQFTPDLMPADVTGSSIYNQQRADFEFRPGPIFANLLLADEINRAPPKTQAALLEAMQERQVTTEGETRPLEPPFIVLATQNPIEYEGTYPLPEAQLDRFLLRIGVGYPIARARVGDARAPDRARRGRGRARARRRPRRRCSRCSERVEQVHVAESVGCYMVDLVAATRERPRRRRSARARAAVARAAQALALPGGARRPRLRDARRRQGGRGACARAPARAQARSSGCSAVARRTSSRESLETRADAAPAEDVAPAPQMTRHGPPRARAPTSCSRARAARALALGRPELAALAAPFALLLALGARRAHPSRSGRARSSTASASWRARTCAARLEVVARQARSSASSARRRCDEGLVADGAEPDPDPPRAGGSGASSRCRSAVRTGARTSSGTSSGAPATRSASSSTKGRSARATSSRSTRAARRSHGCSRPLETQAFSATRSRAPGARGSSSPTCGRSRPATACGASTGARARGAASPG